MGVFEYGNISYGAGEMKNSWGYYFDIGYNIGALFLDKMRLIPWVRWTEYNTADNTKSAGDSEKEYHFKKWLIGLFFQPILNVVLKADYGEQERELGKQKTKIFNFGAGYIF